MASLEVRVEWTVSASAEERLRPVYDLLLREVEQQVQPRPTVRELLLKDLESCNNL